MMLKIFITDLSAYNSGYLIGRWVNLPMSQEERSEVILEILREGEQAVKCGKHEEWFITDYEWTDATIFKVSEYENLDVLNQKVEALEEVETSELPKVAFLLEEGLVNNLDNAIEHIDDVIVYENSSFTDIAEQYIDECVDLNGYSAIIVNHIDYMGIGRDLEMEGNYFSVGSDIYQYLG